MTKTKKPDDPGRFYDLMERLFKEIDQQSIEAEVIALRAAKPEMNREQLAQHLTKKAAVRVASVGAAAGIPGGPLGVLAMAPDIFNLVLQQSRLVLSIAFLYDEKPHLQDRFKEVLATLAVATGASAGRQGARLLIAKGLERAAAGKIARKIFGRFLVRRLPSIAPLLGTVVGGSINYFSVRSVGKAATNFYSQKHGETPAKEERQQIRAAKAQLVREKMSENVHKRVPKSKKSEE